MAAEKEKTVLSIKEISKATGNFSKSNIIGEGNFAIVYWGQLKDGSIVAVKCAKKEMYEKHVQINLKNEIHTLSKVEHANLVRVYGYLEKDGAPIIVSEYVGNGNLREHLNGFHADQLGIEERLQIAIDIAAGVTYLHSYADHPIIHRDIKASNILITENCRAKVSDFGFGHLIEGQAMKNYKSGAVHVVIDKRLGQRRATTVTAEKMLELAERCMASTRDSRPSMRECGDVLWSIRSNLQKFPVDTPPVSRPSSWRSQNPGETAGSLRVGSRGSAMRRSTALRGSYDSSARRWTASRGSSEGESEKYGSPSNASSQIGSSRGWSRDSSVVPVDSRKKEKGGKRCWIL